MSGIVAGYFPHIPFPRALGKDYVEPDVRGLAKRRNTFGVAATLPSADPTLDRRKAIFEFIRSMIDVTGAAPSIGEIKEHIGIKSSNYVYDHLEKLAAAGYIKVALGQARAIRILKDYPGESPPKKILHTCNAVAPSECKACQEVMRARVAGDVR